jgi:hypothetical protein
MAVVESSEDVAIIHSVLNMFNCVVIDIQNHDIKSLHGITLDRDDIKSSQVLQNMRKLTILGFDRLYIHIDDSFATQKAHCQELGIELLRCECPQDMVIADAKHALKTGIVRGIGCLR